MIIWYRYKVEYGDEDDEKRLSAHWFGVVDSFDLELEDCTVSVETV